MNLAKLGHRLAQAQDRHGDIGLLRDALAIQSVTGNETPFAQFLATRLSALGFATQESEFLAGRSNIWGIRQGDGGPNLMITGHTDTVHVRGWEAYWQDDPRRDPFGGIVRDGSLWGRGACDLKGGICAAIAALELLQQVGLDPGGGLTLAFVGDEESGEAGTGLSAGMKDLVSRIMADEIPRPDFAIYVEPTNLDVYTAQIGFFIADITLTGKTAYFGTPELGCDALKAAHEVLSRIWIHAGVLDARPVHDLVGPSSILVTSLDTIDRFIAVPGQCRLSVIGTLRPGETIDDAVTEFEDALAAANLDDGIALAIDYPASRDHPQGGTPVEIPPDTEPVLRLQECVKSVCPGAGCVGGAPYWSELPFLTERIGCPAVYFAPGDIAVAHTHEERIEVEEYLAAVRAFALFVAQYCGIRADAGTLN